MEPWSLEIFAVEAGAQSFFLPGAQTKVLILAKWSPRVQPCSHLYTWSPKPLWDPEDSVDNVDNWE